MPTADPDMKLVLAKIGDIRQKLSGMAVHRLARHDPTNVRPQTTVAGRMWIAFLVGVLVMNAVRGDPEYRSTFKSQGSAQRKKIFHPLWSFVAAMRQQTVVAHADTEASGDPPQNERQQQRFPTKHEERSQRSDMEEEQEKGGNQTDGLRERAVAGKNAHPFPFRQIVALC